MLIVEDSLFVTQTLLKDSGFTAVALIYGVLMYLNILGFLILMRRRLAR